MGDFDVNVYECGILDIINSNNDELVEEFIYSIEGLNKDNYSRYILRERLYDLKEIVNGIKKNKINMSLLDFYKNITLLDLYDEIEKRELDDLSEVLFNNQHVILYLNNLFRRAKKTYLCQFSGNIIHVGDEYINYRPLLINIDTNMAYYLKRSIICCPYYNDKLPTNIKEFELFNYFLNKGMIYKEEDLYGFSTLYGNDDLTIKKLRRKK